MMKIRRIIVIIFLSVSVLPLPSSLRKGVAQEMVIVTPPGYENVEGDTGQDGVDMYPEGFRIQTVLSASQFSTIPESHRYMIGYRLRPDGSLNSEFTRTWDHLLLRLSTTTMEVDQLSMMFAMNIGDDETVVYDGPITWHTANTGPLGGPKNFGEYGANFTTPFYYDPSQGNLLIDTLASGPAGNLNYDQVSQNTSLSSTVINLDSGATYASDELLSHTGGTVFQFIFIPEPSTFILCSLLTVATLTLVRCRGEHIQGDAQ